ncbi:MAG: CBS domain-containing protein [Gammaproteobacteria bacterium]|nr:CBS domain-containing protein [Gammaproteobacteria bacterium]
MIDIVGVPATATCGEASKIAAESSHRRLTVYDDRVDRISGVLNSLDLLGTDPDAPISPFIAPVRFVPGSQSIEELLVSLRMSSTRMAVVVDEYGGVEGIVTIEDLLEEVVGEITDEYDDDKSHRMIKKLGPNKLRVNARIDIERLAELTPVHLPDGNYETLGGFLIDLARNIPEEGTAVSYRKYTFTVEQVSDRAIQQVIIKW